MIHIHNLPTALFFVAFVITQWPTPALAAFVVPDYSVLTMTKTTTTRMTTQRNDARFVRNTQMTQMTQTQLACQLLGMNCATPTEFALTWPGFCQRGGDTDIHRDGWGLAYYHGMGLRQFHDVEAASTSPLAQFVGQQSMETSNMMAHIRYATAGAINLANVHPFAREMWGIQWTFCHNGQVPLMEQAPDFRLGDSPSERIYVPVGNTDSEAVFCALLNALRAKFPENMPSLPVLYEELQNLCHQLVDYDRTGTILNFLMACGPHVLWVYSWPGKRPGSKVWNGLHYTVRERSTCNTNNISLIDPDYTVDVHVGDDRDARVCIVATKPLTTDEEWVELKPGELILLDGGLPHVSARELFRVELLGHGLDNHGKALKPVRLEEDMRRYQYQKEFFAAGGI
jgi:predicted glutamine amidotransferase